ncbi:MAG: family 16 glycosylhydrolase [Geminicoccaceae bacterium]|nr:family 16 glycosylhydrolase [Geminicoccaceae bacterium]
MPTRNVFDASVRAALALLLAPVPSQAAPPAGYELVFGEEFDGAAVDFADRWDTHWVAWNIRHLAGNGDRAIKAADHERLRDAGATVGEMLSAYLPDRDAYLHPIEDGVLRLQAWPVPADLRERFDGFPFVAGMLAGPRAHAQAYGYWETRLRIEALGTGQHFALWLLPIDGSWPPEIDMLEAVGDDGLLRANTHQSTRTMPISTFAPPDRIDAWLTIGFLWTTEEMVWTVDDAVVRREPATIGAVAMYPLLTWEIGGKWPGPPDADTPWPGAVAIDYLRIYARR